jgi:predicted permease
VTSGFFEALGITLHGGRVFGRHEPAPVVVVNAALAGRLWPGGDAVGKSLYFGTRAAEVIGVVGDVRHDGLARDARGALYIHASRAPRSNLNLFVRTARDPLSAAQEVRRAVWAVDPELPIAELAPLDRTLGDHVAQPRFFALLMLCFGVLALGLASLGLYGVISYAVGRRTREIGIRIALGATRRDVRRLVVTQAMSLAVAGLALGLLGAAWLGRGLSGLLFGIGPYDPTIFGGVSLLLLAVALAASYGPAHRATRVDPVDALRSS